MGLAVWTTDQAGPFQTKPYPGYSWQPRGQPQRQAHEYIRNGTAKLLTLFHPADGQVRVKGVTSCPNTVLHPWLKQELSEILATLPQPAVVLEPTENRTRWERWFEGLSERPELPNELPPLRKPGPRKIVPDTGALRTYKRQPMVRYWASMAASLRLSCS